MAYNKTLARHLRRQPTDAEKRLWYVLRTLRGQGFKFRRQHPIDPYVVDFACIEKRLIIEADGGQHADNEEDTKRTAYLEEKGWQVMRFWNNDILANTEAVLETIAAKLKKDI